MRYCYIYRYYDSEDVFNVDFFTYYCYLYNFFNNNHDFYKVDFYYFNFNLLGMKIKKEDISEVLVSYIENYRKTPSIVILRVVEADINLDSL